MDETIEDEFREAQEQERARRVTAVGFLILAIAVIALVIGFAFYVGFRNGIIEGIG